MQPLFFGQSDKQLFGIYHAPRTITPCSLRSVLLCPSVTDEYLTTHWSILRFSRLLAEAGFHVLRFDYFGTGDSAGEFVDAGSNQWISDIQAAAREIADLSATRKLTLVGFRLGATLAARAAIDIDLDRLVAWEPIMKGKDFITSLSNSTAYRKELYGARFFDDPDEVSITELTGYPFSQSCLESIQQLDMENTIRGSSYPLDVVVSKPSPKFEEITGQLHSERRRMSYHYVDQAGDWIDGLSGVERVQVPNRVLEVMLEVVGGA